MQNRTSDVFKQAMRPETKASNQESCDSRMEKASKVEN